MKKKKSFATRNAYKLVKFIKSFDSFGEGVTFEIDGDSLKRSYFGAFFSIAIVILTLSYAVDRYEVMVS